LFSIPYVTLIEVVQELSHLLPILVSFSDRLGQIEEADRWLVIFLRRHLRFRLKRRNVLPLKLKSSGLLVGQRILEVPARPKKHFSILARLEAEYLTNGIEVVLKDPKVR